MAGPLRDPGPEANRAVGSMADETAADAAAVDATAGDQPAEATAAEPSVEPLPDAPVDAIDEWTLDQLHRRASEVGLEGRWDMSREELVEALRDETSPPT